MQCSLLSGLLIISTNNAVASAKNEHLRYT
jgi:hypothetical protein